MTSVLLLVFILPWLGAVLGVITAIAVLVVPFAVQRRKSAGERFGDQTVSGGDAKLARPIGALVAGLATRPLVVLPLAVIVTAGATVFALQVPAKFDVEDFFSGDTDFVVSLDQLDAHVGDRGGEPALLYVEGDLADPEALAAVPSPHRRGPGPRDGPRWPVTPMASRSTAACSSGLRRPPGNRSRWPTSSLSRPG